MSAELIGKVDAMFRRLKKFGYISDNLSVSDLLQNADEDLFHKMQMRRPQHCLHHLLPPVRVVDKLRERGHPFTLPEYNTVIHKKSFVVRSFYHLGSRGLTVLQFCCDFIMDARSAMRPCYILLMFFYIFFMPALVGQTAERIFTKLSHVVDIRHHL